MGNPNQPRDSKGRWTKRLGASTVVVVGILTISGSISGSVGSGAGSTQSAVSQSVRANVDKGKSSARKGKREDAWREMGVKRLKQATKRATNCVLNSYGEVQRFFTRTPCRSLERMLFAVRDTGGNTIVVSVAWVKMGSTGHAAELKRLADTNGTGNVSPLGGALVDAAGVRFTGQHYDSRRAGKLVVIAEAEPLSGRPDPGFLKGLAEVAVEFPAP